VAKEQLQQAELLGRELHGDSPGGHLAPGRVKRHVSGAQNRRGGGPRPAKERPDARRKLLEGERLGQVVVRSRVQPCHSVRHRVPSGQQEDRHPASPFPELPAEREPIHARQHDVQHHQVVVLRPGAQQVEGIRPVSADLHGIAFLLQSLAKRDSELHIVFHDQDAHLSRKYIEAEPA